jgi:hypothetical protein
LEACQELANLQSSVGELTLEQDKEDSWSFVWGTEKFRPRDYCRHFFRNIQSKRFLPAISKTKRFMNHRVFSWLLLMDRLNTSDNTALACDLTDRR